ncbi:hypothetical protein ACFXG4_04105 [Nocardia sp. NPDC059246]|uniref:hypothetical protein n=1 Tax=unclassified Nocardia TaxID=2637762 RepID=UPI0036B2A300
MTDPAGRDILDAIDELVDEQLAGYDNRSGYDFNVNQDKCPHPWCDEDWHGLKITTQMRQMRRAGWIDPNYRHADDDSQILCPGSTFTGDFVPAPTPLRPVGTIHRQSDAGWEAIGTVDANPLRARAAEGGWGDAVTAIRGLTHSFNLRLDEVNPELLQTLFGRDANEVSGSEYARAASSPRWWRCDDTRGYDISLEREQDDPLGIGNPPFRVAALQRDVLRAGRQTVELISDQAGYRARYGIGATGEQWLEVHCRERPAVGSWYLRDESAAA